MTIEHGVPLAPLTTLELGGAARHYLRATRDDDVVRGLAWAKKRGLSVFLLGGGSNTIVSDRGFEGLVINLCTRGRRVIEETSDGVVIEVAAGENWDDFVAWTAACGYVGLECLSGIPGSTGATPIQNVGAYGQEVSACIESVHVFDRVGGRHERMAPDACGFAYRDSVFKRTPDRFAVLNVVFRLRRGVAPEARYEELRRRLAGEAAATPARMRAVVLELRRSKSMVIEPGDPNRRSVGSFFTNPVVPESQAQDLVARAVSEGLVSRADEVPLFPAGSGMCKLAAGWLIERAGIARGLRRGHVGVSSRHALALVHHGGGTTAELMALAEEVRSAVADRFGIHLAREPVLV